jgi:type II secretory ATPase GspE/PulE/Tfp pilus assembly ATPase PilB-like protein
VVEEDGRKLISDGASTDTLRQWHRSHGGTTLLEEGLRQAERHVTSLDEVMRVAFVE